MLRYVSRHFTNVTVCLVFRGLWFYNSLQHLRGHDSRIWCDCQAPSSQSRVLTNLTYFDWNVLNKIHTYVQASNHLIWYFLTLPFFNLQHSEVWEWKTMFKSTLLNEYTIYDDILSLAFQLYTYPMLSPVFTAPNASSTLVPRFLHTILDSLDSLKLNLSISASISHSKQLGLESCC